MKFKFLTAALVVLASMTTASAQSAGQTYTKTYTYSKWCGDGDRVKISPNSKDYIEKIMVTLDRANGDNNFTRVRVDGEEVALLVVPYTPARPIDPTYPIRIGKQASDIELYCEGGADALLTEVKIIYRKNVDPEDYNSEWSGFTPSSNVAQNCKQIIDVVRYLQINLLSPDEFKQKFFDVKLQAARTQAIAKAYKDTSRKTYNQVMNLLAAMQRAEPTMIALMERDAAFEPASKLMELKAKLESLYE